VALKEYESYRELKKVVKLRQTFEPNPDNYTEYDQLYSVYRGLHAKLTGVCRRLNEPDQAHQA
jgi:sugar (pentulose or hexulose) kinase